MTNVGPNAAFLNKYFGASLAEPAAKDPNIPIGTLMAARKEIAADYLRHKFEEVSKKIDSKTVVLDPSFEAQIEDLRNLIPNEVSFNGYIGVIFNQAAASFKKLFADFDKHLKTDVHQGLIEKGTDRSKTPLAEIIEAGVDSAAHIWEAILKSVLVKQGSNIKLDQFKKAYEKSKDLLLDITDIPQKALVILESYLFKREKPYNQFTPIDQAFERISSNVRHEAVSYDLESGAVNLDQDFMSQDTALAAEKDKLDRVAKDSDYKIHSCAGKQMIPLLFKYMDQIFEKHLFPYFDQMISETKFA